MLRDQHRRMLDNPRARNIHRHDDADIPADIENRFEYNIQLRGYDDAKRSADFDNPRARYTHRYDDAGIPADVENRFKYVKNRSRYRKTDEICGFIKWACT